jgi:hypothetical protein
MCGVKMGTHYSSKKSRIELLKEKEVEGYHKYGELY